MKRETWFCDECGADFSTPEQISPVATLWHGPMIPKMGLMGLELTTTLSPGLATMEIHIQVALPDASRGELGRPYREEHFGLCPQCLKRIVSEAVTRWLQGNETTTFILDSLTR